MLGASMSSSNSHSSHWSSRVFGAWVRQVSGPTLRADLLAGLLGTVLALPQGIAFASLAGLPMEMGIYSAIVPTIVAALFGSSWHVVSGPTNALSLALLSMLAPLALTGSADQIAQTARDQLKAAGRAVDDATINRAAEVNRDLEAQVVPLKAGESVTLAVVPLASVAFISVSLPPA